MMFKKNYILLILILLTTSLPAQQERKYIRQGTQFYNDEKYDKSDIQYRKALDKNNNSFEAKYNVGDVLYKQNKYKEAAQQFEEITSLARNKKERAKVYHNIGNSYLQTDSLEGSIAAYKQALKNNPYDMDTKYNLSYALKLLEKQKQQQNQCNKNCDKNKDQKQKQDKNKQDKDNQKQNQQKQEQQKKQQQAQQEKQKMSKEDAARMLKALQQNENKLQNKLKKQNATKVNVEKDW